MNIYEAVDEKSWKCTFRPPADDGSLKWFICLLLLWLTPSNRIYRQCNFPSKTTILDRARVTRCDELEEVTRGKWKERMKIMNSRVLFSTFFSRLGFSDLIARSHFEWRHKEYPVFIIWRPVAHVLPLQGNFLIFWISNKLSEISNKLIDFRLC